MADSKVPALGALTAPADDDVLHIVDISDTTDDPTGTSKKITRAVLLASLPGAFQATGSTNITTTAATLALNTEVYDPDTNYSNTAGDITVTADGYYHVDVNVPINDDGTGGATRGRCFIWLERDQATSTWIAVNNIRGQEYCREASGGDGVHAAGIVLLVASEHVRVRIQSSSTVDISTESAEASLNIHRIRAT